MSLQRFFSREFLGVFIPAVLLAVGAFWLAFKYVKPAPPSSFVIAAASKGSPYYQLAMRYREIIAKNGVDMEVQETAGSFANLKSILDPNSGVDAALIQGGIANTDQAPDTSSVGRLLIEPVWVFYRGERIDKISQLQGKRILIGPSGSGTDFLARKLLAAHGVSESNSTFIAMELPQYIETLKTGGADAGFLVLGAEARTVQTLLRTPDVNLMNMALADGLIQRYPFLSRVTLRQGAVDLSKGIPPEDTSLVATQAALLVRNDLHPALINLLAQAVLQVQRQPQLTENGESRLFPLSSNALALDDPEFPTSSEARTVYKSGPSFLQRVLPFWVANLLNRFIVLMVPLLGIIIPLVRIVPILYNWRMKQRILNWYKELKNLERDLPRVEDLEALRRKDLELDRIEEGVQKISVPIQYTADLYNLRDHVDFVRRRVMQLRAGKVGPVT